MIWASVRVVMPKECEDTAADVLMEAGASGVVVDDPALLKEALERELGPAAALKAAAGVEPGKVAVTGYFPADGGVGGKVSYIKRELARRLALLTEAGALVGVSGFSLDDLDAAVTVGKVDDQDWATAWKAYYKPERIGDRIVVSPSWETFEPAPGDIVIKLDPGMAFGTGKHPTTALCVRELEATVRPGTRVLDVGTGSGILSVAVAKLGAGRVVAVDLDPVAVEVARENVEVNGVQDTVTVVQGDLAAGVSGEFDIIVANIIADVIIRLLPDVPKLLAPGGRFIGCGIIDERRQDVERAVGAAGLRVDHVRTSGDWVLVSAVRES